MRLERGSYLSTQVLDPLLHTLLATSQGKPGSAVSEQLALKPRRFLTPCIHSYLANRPCILLRYHAGHHNLLVDLGRSIQPMRHHCLRRLQRIPPSQSIEVRRSRCQVSSQC